MHLAIKMYFRAISVEALVYFFNEFLPIEVEEIKALQAVGKLRNVKRRQIYAVRRGGCQHYNFIVEDCSVLSLAWRPYHLLFLERLK